MSGKVIKIKKSISGAKTTKKITRAMELVAASKMKSFQAFAVSSREYVFYLNQLLSSEVFTEITKSNPFFKKIKSPKNLFILYSSDKGLCGSMNNKLFKSMVESPNFVESSYVITLGKKGENFVNKNKYNLFKSFSAFPESNEYLEITEIVDTVIKAFFSGEFNNIYLVAPNYKSTLVFYPKVKKIFPLDKEVIESFIKLISLDTNNNYKLKEPVFAEPNKQLLVNRILEYVCVGVFYSSFLELKAVEYSSRMVAMQSATNSAKEIIDNLTLQYNRARQAAITQEIVEIVAGI